MAFESPDTSTDLAELTGSSLLAELLLEQQAKIYFRTAIRARTSESWKRQADHCILFSLLISSHQAISQQSPNYCLATLTPFPPPMRLFQLFGAGPEV